MADLFIPRKDSNRANQPDYGIDMRVIETWAKNIGGIKQITSTDGTVTITNPFGPVTDLHAAGGGGGGYASLTGPGETVTPGALNQAGNFTVVGTSAVGFGNTSVRNTALTGYFSGGIYLESNNAQTYIIDNTTASFTWTIGGPGTPQMTLGQDFNLLAPRDATFAGVRNVSIETTGTLGSVSITSAGQPIYVGGTSDKVGFFGVTGTVRPVIFGSRGGNNALQNLLTALSTMGLISDSTTP